MLKRRRPIERWSARDVVDTLVGCVTSDPDYHYVRTAYVMRMDLDRLPKDFEEKLVRDAKEAGYDFEGVQPFTVFYLDFEEADRVNVFMDFNTAALVRCGGPAPSLEAARVAAEAWVTDGGRKIGPWVAFEYTPGIYQAAVLEAITGREVDQGPWSVIWALPGGEEHVMVRRYPPRATDDPVPYDAPLNTGAPADGGGLGDGYSLLPVAVYRRELAHRP